MDSLRIAMTSKNYKDYGLILVHKVKPLLLMCFWHLDMKLEAEMRYLITCPITGVIPSRDRIILNFHNNEPKFFIRICHNCIFGPPYKSAFLETS